MGKECEKLEILKVFDEEGEEEKGDEIELSLELSIGGRYGKTENSKGKICGENVNGQSNNFSFSRSNFSSCVGDVTAENGCESVDLQRRREIQALRRQEARRKREEKVKKSRGQNGVGFVEDKLFLEAQDKLFLEAQKLQARVQERETRERESFSEEKARKKEKKGSKEVGDDLSLSLFTDNKTCSQQAGRECLYPKVQYVAPRNGVQVLESWGPNVPEEEKKRNSSVDCDSEHSNGMNDSRNRKSVSNRSVEHCSSAVSDYQSVSHKGGSSSDTGSHSSSLRPRQHPDLSGNALDQLESHDSSSQTETDQVLGGAKLAPPSNPQSTWSKSSEISKPDSSLNQTNNTSSTSETLSKETSGDLNDKPPRPSNYNTNAASIPHMPCVSATGNGPNGKTITGFLYKYTKTEVSIMCVCHGSSFSPAEFVEHAGGVDISHPLKHITVVPSAFR